MLSLGGALVIHQPAQVLRVFGGCAAVCPARGLAGRIRHVDHGAMGWVVGLPDQPLGIYEDQDFTLHHAVWWQTTLALALALTHAAARCTEAHADLLRRRNTVIQTRHWGRCRGGRWCSRCASVRPFCTAGWASGRISPRRESRAGNIWEYFSGESGYGLARMFDLAQYGCGSGTSQSALC